MRLNRRFLLPGLAIWLLFPVAAIVNGMAREAVLAPMFGRRAAEVLSVVILLAVIYAIAFVFLRRVREPYAAAELWALGACWVILTIAFEVMLFGVVLGVPTRELIAAYNVFAGELWSFVVLGVLLAPPLTGALARRSRGGGKRESPCPTQ